MSASGGKLTNSDIDAAFAGDEFNCLFQPKFSLHNGKITGAEALVHWRHHSLGHLPPGLFLSHLAQQGRMHELTQFVFDRALSAASQWTVAGFDWRVHVNLSPEDLNFPGLAQALTIRLRQHHIEASSIRLELTEQDMSALTTPARKRLARLLKAGFSLAVQGPSAVPMHDSDELPIAELQLRGTALLGLAEALSPTKSGRLLGQMRAAKKLGREISAIGLEKMVDVQTATALGFDSATGFALARPMTVETLIEGAMAQNSRGVRNTSGQSDGFQAACWPS